MDKITIGLDVRQWQIIMDLLFKEWESTKDTKLEEELAEILEEIDPE